jgi:hypothetical protein
VAVITGTVAGEEIVLSMKGMIGTEETLEKETMGVDVVKEIRGETIKVVSTMGE